jgi:hypothetical protein
MTVSRSDFGFYAFVGGCLLLAIHLLTLMIGGEVSRPRLPKR